MKIKNIVAYLLFLVIIAVQSCESTPRNNNEPDQAVKESPKKPVEKNEPAPKPVEKDLAERKEAEIGKAAKNNFEKVIRDVEKIDYVLKKYEELEAKDNFLEDRIEAANERRTIRGKELIPQLKISKIEKIRRASIKGTKDLGNRLYERAEVESWEMKNESEAKSTFKEIDKLSQSTSWEDISKSPITCFRVRNEIIFITPGGFYMLDKVSKIKNFFEENL